MDADDGEYSSETFEASCDDTSPTNRGGGAGGDAAAAENGTGGPPPPSDAKGGDTADQADHGDPGAEGPRGPAGASGAGDDGADNDDDEDGLYDQDFAGSDTGEDEAKEGSGEGGGQGESPVRLPAPPPEGGEGEEGAGEGESSMRLDEFMSGAPPPKALAAEEEAAPAAGAEADSGRPTTSAGTGMPRDQLHSCRRGVRMSREAASGGSAGGGSGKMQDDAMLLERIDSLRAELEGAREREAALERQNTGLRRQLQEANSRRASRSPSASPHPPMQRRSSAQFEDLTLEEAQTQLMKQSEELVSQGEKAFKLNSELRTVKDELEYARQDLGAARAALLPLAVGSVEEEEGEEGQDSYAHVPVPQLARLAAASVKRMSEAARGASSRPGSRNVTASGVFQSSLNVSRATSRASRPESQGAGAEGGGSAAIGALKARAARAEKERDDALEELSVLREVAREAKTLRSRAESFSTRIMIEKQGRAQALGTAEEEREKVSALSEHIEKLMVHLKHESAAKAKALATAKQSKKEAQLAGEREKVFRRRVAARDKMIRRLQDSTGVLEGQLRLMDEKYIDLRAKLDVSRQQSQKEIKRLHQQADDLYSRLAAAGSVGSRLMRREGGRQQAPPSEPGDASLSSSTSSSAFSKRGGAGAGAGSRRLPEVKGDHRRGDEGGREESAQNQRQSPPNVAMAGSLRSRGSRSATLLPPPAEVVGPSRSGAEGKEVLPWEDAQALTALAGGGRAR